MSRGSKRLLSGKRPVPDQKRLGRPPRRVTIEITETAGDQLHVGVLYRNQARVTTRNSCRGTRTAMTCRRQKNNTCRQTRAMLLGAVLLVSCGALYIGCYHDVTATPGKGRDLPTFFCSNGRDVIHPRDCAVDHSIPAGEHLFPQQYLRGDRILSLQLRRSDRPVRREPSRTQRYLQLQRCDGPVRRGPAGHTDGAGL